VKAVTKFGLFFVLILAQSMATAARLQDYAPFDYDVRFTNPECATYKYSQPVLSNDGQPIYGKPKNVFCKSADAVNNLGRAGTPSEKLLQWISQDKTKEIFMTYLSFSSQPITQALCKAMTERNVKVQIVIDQETDVSRMQELEACGQDNFQFYQRGHVPGIDFAHNKLFIVNPNSTDLEFQVSFGSGNMTSGILLHHENWHFITTNRKSYFAQAHLCLMNGEINHAATGKEFRTFIKSCLAAIQAEPESDIQIFFVPGFGTEAFNAISEAIKWSDEIKLMSHRFSFNKLTEALTAKLATASEFRLKLLFDDDLFWVKAPNTRHENAVVKNLEASGAKVKYLQTNHNQKLLQHNKYIVFKSATQKAAFVGAGNLTGTAFSSNWENFYLVKIPTVVDRLEAQHDYLYESLGSTEGQLPSNNVMP
jgi:hypothetical protein